jgi:2-oxoglutarate ferredoxin oxidoreductase subunit delta
MELLGNNKGKISVTKKYILKINKNRCKGCQLCINVCPKKHLKMSVAFNKSGLHFIEEDQENECIGCKNCVIICPDTAIELYQEEEETK